MTEKPNRMRRVLRTLFFWVTAIALVSTPTFVHAQLSTAQTIDNTQNLFLPSVVTTSDTEEAPAPGDTLSTEERMAIVQDVETRVDNLLPPVGTPVEERNFLQELDQLGDGLLTIPGVIATFVSTPTLTVQVVMEDGLSIAIVNNRPVEPASSPQAIQAAAEQFVDQNVAPLAVVGSNRAVVTNFDGGDAVAAEVRALLRDAGYEVLGLGASLNDMQNYTNLGALYLDTHGVQFRHYSVKPNADGSKTLIGGDFSYGLQTSTQVELSTLASYKAALDNGELILSIGEETTGRKVKFAITDKFIAKHWSFDKAIVIIHSCYGGAAPFKPGSTCKGGNCFSVGDPGVLDPSALRAATLAKGASAVVSFDNLTNADYARPSILFLLDRLLGSNEVQAVSNPPLRPFPLDEVRAEMGRQNLLSFHKPNSTLFGFEFGGNRVNLTFDATDARAGLAPSVERMTVLDDPVQRQGELKIKGTFGNDQGEVTISGAPTTIKSWNATEIVVNTPFNGQGAAGDLIVKGPGAIESNPVPLTLWQGTFKVQMIPNRGSLEVTANLNLHFRADLHESRQTLDSTPTVKAQEVYLNSDNSRITASGIYVDPDPESNTHITWSGGSALTDMSNFLVDTLSQAGGQIAAQHLVQEDGFAGGLVALDPTSGSARFCLASQGGTYDVQGSGGGGSVNVPFPSVLLLIPELADSTLGLLACFDAVLHDNYTIAAGVRTTTFEETTMRVEWTTFEPVAPPTTDTPG